MEKSVFRKNIGNEFYDFLTVKNNQLLDSVMMSKPPKPMSGDEICPICKKPKSEHKPGEMLVCSRKIFEQQSDDET
jgi:muconolactone delta-isomerase